MMENVEAMVHPAFAEMLKQLSPLDAEFMFYILRMKILLNKKILNGNMVKDSCL
jgi:hypothetical protein